MEPRLRLNRLGSNNSGAQVPKILVNDRPHNFFRHGVQRGADNRPEIGEFRRALPQFIAVGVKNILLFVYGMTLGFPTIVIPAIQGGDGREPSDIVLNRDQISWFSSINLICVPLGCVVSGAFTQPIGKRKAMQIVNIPILVAWLLFHFSTNIGYLYAGLCLSGLSGGLMEAPVLTYVAEITTPKYRGILAASGSACVIMGVFIQFILGSILDWRTIAAVSTVFPVISIFALFFIPESPHWLIRTNRLPEAVKSLMWLRGWVPEYDIENEFNELYDSIIVKPLEESRCEGPKKSLLSRKFGMFKKRSFLSPFALVLLTFFIGHFSGKTTLQTYAVQIFHTLKAPIDKYHATILLGLAELIGTILCIILIHFTGKRPLVFASTIGCGLCFFGAATYAYFLNVVPGFAVTNVVVNASLLVPQENIITLKNVTEIFDKEEEALEKAGFINNEFMYTTLLPEIMDATTMLDFDYDNDDMNATALHHNRSTRGTDFDDTFNITDDYFVFIDNRVDDFEVDFNQTDNDDYITTNETSENTAAPSPTLIEEILKPFSEEHSEIQKKILVAVPKQKKNKWLWVPLVLLLGSAFFAHLGIRLIPWMLIGEVFPAAIRSNASGVSGGMGYIFGFLANKLFLQMLATMTMPGTFWFYASVSFCGTILLYFFLPETEGKSLTDIENEFAGKKSKNIKSEEVENTQNDNVRVTEITQEELENVKMWRIPTENLPFDASKLPHDAVGIKKSKATNPRTRELHGSVNRSFSWEDNGRNTTKL